MLHVHIRAVGRNPRQYCAVLKRLPSCTRQADRSGGGNKNDAASLFNHALSKNDGAVLVNQIQLVELIEGVTLKEIPSVVRLQRLNNCLRGRGKQLYFSPSVGFKFLGCVVDRKFRLLRRRTAIDSGKLINKMVERRTQLMNDGTNSHSPQEQRHVSVNAKADKSNPGFRIAINNRIVMFPKEHVGFGMKVTDVFFGPFNLHPRASQGMAHGVNFTESRNPNSRARHGNI